MAPEATETDQTPSQVPTTTRVHADPTDQTDPSEPSVPSHASDESDLTTPADPAGTPAAPPEPEVAIVVPEANYRVNDPFGIVSPVAILVAN